MAHTPRALALLTEAKRLRVWAADLAQGTPARRRFGERDNGEGALRAEAAAIEASVLIRFKPVPAFDFSPRECFERFRSREMENVYGNLPPKLQKVIRDIRNFERTGRWPNDTGSFFR